MVGQCTPIMACKLERLAREDRCGGWKTKGIVRPGSFEAGGAEEKGSLVQEMGEGRWPTALRPAE